MKIYTIPNLGDTGWQDLSLAFSGCTNLTTFHGGELGGVTTIEGIFKDAISVVPDVPDWDTSSITSMAGLSKMHGQQNQLSVIGTLLLSRLPLKCSMVHPLQCQM